MSTVAMSHMPGVRTMSGGQGAGQWCALGSLGRYALCITTSWGLLSKDTKKALALVARKKGIAGSDMQCAGYGSGWGDVADSPAHKRAELGG